jgi:hypothetical protein
MILDDKVTDLENILFCDEFRKGPLSQQEWTYQAKPLREPVIKMRYKGAKLKEVHKPVQNILHIHDSGTMDPMRSRNWYRKEKESSKNELRK